MRSFRNPIADTIRVMPYLEMQALSDIRPLAESGAADGSMTLEGGFIERLSDLVIDTILAFIATAPMFFWITAEYYLHGAVCRPAPGHTAFGLQHASLFGLARSK